MSRRLHARPPVTINRHWFGADEVHPKLKRSLGDSLQRWLSRSLALVG